MAHRELAHRGELRQTFRRHRHFITRRRKAHAPTSRSRPADIARGVHARREHEGREQHASAPEGGELGHNLFRARSPAERTHQHIGTACAAR